MRGPFAARSQRMERQPPTDSSDAANEPGRDRAQTPYLGGADAVEKTTYASDVHGAEADGAADSPVRLTATVGHDSGLGLFGWTAVALALVALVAYAAGLFR